ncbi:MAG: chloride channel protein [Bacteroidales bacterium]|nr:chloride channel protein [Bacteroidales bacterium]
MVMKHERKKFLLFDSILLGVVGALGAQLFLYLLHLVMGFSLQDLAGYQAPGLPNMGESVVEVTHKYSGLIILGVIVVGALISGYLIYTFAPEAEGHGTDTAVRAFHRTGGRIRWRVTPLKILASALTIGTGGSAGREGPTALFSAGIGSIYATVKNSSNHERRLLVLIGMAAGLSAIFRAPIGTAIFAIEVLYNDMDFEADALVYTLLGSLVAYMVTGFFTGWEPLFIIPKDLMATDLTTFFYLLILGLLSGILGMILPNLFYGVRDLFHKIRIKPHFKPAIGALGVGLIALALPQVLGGGYGWIQKAIDGHIVLWMLPVILIAKMLSFALTVSSGGSGGVFAPSLFVGAFLGSFVALLFGQPPAIFAVIGMAAVFGSSARVPLATLIMVTEMTGGYTLLAPAALTVLIAYLLQSHLVRVLKLKYESLYEGQVPDKSFSPVHQIDKIRKILSFYRPQLSLTHEEIDQAKMLDMLEASVPIDISEDHQLFFGSLKRRFDLTVNPGEEHPETIYYKEARVLAVFRDGEWIYPHSATRLNKGDELLLIGDAEVIKQIRKDFSAVSKVFSMLIAQVNRNKLHALQGWYDLVRRKKK